MNDGCFEDHLFLVRGGGGGPLTLHLKKKV